MYSRITHHTVEEHFHHAHAVTLATAMNAHRVKSQLLNTTSAAVFELLCRSFWTRFVWHMRQLVVSVTDSHASEASLRDEVNKNADLLGGIIQDSFGKDHAVLAAAPTLGQQFSESLKSLVDSVIKVVHAITDGSDASAATTAMNQAVVDFSSVVSSVYSQGWPQPVVQTLWSLAATTWVEQAQNRKLHKWGSDLAASNQTHDILVSGQADGTAGFADVFSGGIEAAFPNQFGI